jgi:hypothetical protein
MASINSQNVAAMSVTELGVRMISVSHGTSEPIANACRSPRP